MIEIDGAQGEGGGQVLRSSLTLSLATGRPFRIDAIRGNRPKPGLLRQHLTCVHAAAEVSGAEVEGAELGSSVLVFRPREVRAGDYDFSVGTAGSTTLVLQTILVPLAQAGASSSVRVQGGTHNKSAPPFGFLRDTFLPQMARIGIGVDLELVRHGFYPAGGGELLARIRPAIESKPLELVERGREGEHAAEILTAGLPARIAEIEAELLGKAFDPGDKPITITSVADSAGPGNVLSVRLCYEQVAEVLTAFGEKGLPAKRVVGQVVRAMRRYLRCDAPVGVHLADQLLVPLALLGGGRFRAVRMTEHARTNVDTVQAFLGDVFDVDEAKGDTMVSVSAS